MCSIHKEIKSLRLRINDIRENTSDQAQWDLLGSLEARLEKLLHKEEIYWKQRCRVDWLNEGDRNTAYFHKFTFARRKRNYIHRLRENDNSLISTQEDLENHITGYYSQLFSSQNPMMEDISKITNLVWGHANHE